MFKIKVLLAFVSGDVLSWQEALSLRPHVAPLFAQREKDLCVSPFSKRKSPVLLH